MSVRLSVRLYIYMSLCTSVYLYVCMYVCRSICLYLRLSIHMSVCLSFYLSVRLSICLSVILSKNSGTNIEYFHVLTSIYFKMFVNLYLYNLNNNFLFLLNFMACEFIYCLPIDFEPNRICLVLRQWENIVSTIGYYVACQEPLIIFYV